MWALAARSVSRATRSVSRVSLIAARVGVASSARWTSTKTDSGAAAPSSFSTLVEMHEYATHTHAKRPLFGQKPLGGSAYEWLTFEEVGQRVAACRAGMAARGVGPGDRVAVISGNRWEWAVGYYAALSLGALYIPMYEQQLPKMWEYILGDSESKMLLVSRAEIYDQVAGYVDTIESVEDVVCFDDSAQSALQAEEDADSCVLVPAEATLAQLLAQGEAAPVAAHRPDPDDICTIIYTSGTTGEPKGVPLSHRAICHNLNAIPAITDDASGHPLITPKDRSLSFLPWAHAYGQTVELNSLVLAGAAMGMVEHVTLLPQNLREVRPTLLFSVPALFNRIYDGVNNKMAESSAVVRGLFQLALDTASHIHKGSPTLIDRLLFPVLDRIVLQKVRDQFGGKIRTAFVGGAAVSPDILEFFDHIGVTIYEGYGLTETAPMIACNVPSSRRVGTVGKPLPGVDVVLLHEDGTATREPNTPGEICCKGPNVMGGYHNKPEATKEALRPLAVDGTTDVYFHTGDLGSFDDDGYLSITGRLKEQYKLENGKFVVPAPVEEQLNLSRFVAQSFVYGDNRLFNVAVIVPDWPAVRAWAKEQGMDSGAPTLSLLDHPAVVELLDAEVKEHAQKLKSYEKPKRWVYETEPFSVTNNLLTPKLSLKRHLIREVYADKLEKMYSDEKRQRKRRRSSPSPSPSPSPS